MIRENQSAFLSTFVLTKPIFYAKNKNWNVYKQKVSKFKLYDEKKFI